MAAVHSTRCGVAAPLSTRPSSGRRAVQAQAAQLDRQTASAGLSAGKPRDSQQQPRKQQLHHTLAACAAAGMAATLVVLGTPSASLAIGIESVDLPSVAPPSGFSDISDAAKTKLGVADETFQKSDTLKELLARSEANKAKNKKNIQEKYCYRQAELGVGDCGGLRYIPGLTENGKQKTPEWLAKLLGVEVPKDEPVQGKTLRELVFTDDE